MDDKAALLAQAARFRRLARDILDSAAEQVLLELATEYEQRAAAIQDDENHTADNGSAAA